FLNAKGIGRERHVSDPYSQRQPWPNRISIFSQVHNEASKILLNLRAFEMYTIFAGWIVLAALFVTRPKTPLAQERKHDPHARTGMWLRGVGFAVVWSIRLPPSAPLLPLGFKSEVIVAVIGIALMLESLLLINAAVRTLGRQWSIR